MLERPLHDYDLDHPTVRSVEKKQKTRQRKQSPRMKVTGSGTRGLLKIRKQRFDP